MHVAIIVIVRRYTAAKGTTWIGKDRRALTLAASVASRVAGHRDRNHGADRNQECERGGNDRANDELLSHGTSPLCLLSCDADVTPCVQSTPVLMSLAL